ncbi:MAG: glycosyltransferase family 9 protein [Candidatus Omnitrophota bacterium]
MGFTFMKRVDYLIGIPVCFILTLWHKILSLFFPDSRDLKDPSKILFIKPSELGAIILSYPLLKKLNTKYPQAELHYLTFKSNRELFEVFVPSIPVHVWTIDESSPAAFVKGVFVLLWKIRKEKFDVVIDLEFFSRFTAILSYLSGAFKRVGFHRYTIEGVYRGDLLTHKIQYNPHLHVSEMYLLMGTAVEKNEKLSPEILKEDNRFDLVSFQHTKEQEKSLYKKLNGLGVDATAEIYLICPGEGRIPLREWPLEYFTRLVTKILSHDNTYVLIVGQQDKAERAKQITQTQNHPQRCINLMGQTTLQELLALMSVSKALVVNDSGMAHLAALTKVRQFVLFGPETPKIFAPLGERITIFYSGIPCSPCLSVFNHRNSACRDNLCLKDISPEQVYDSVFMK